MWYSGVALRVKSGHLFCLTVQYSIFNCQMFDVQPGVSLIKPHCHILGGGTVSNNCSSSSLGFF